ncbi:hypothetical protein GCM10020000_77190 [Streptomyces olivoverticillatus]
MVFRSTRTSPTGGARELLHQLVGVGGAAGDRGVRGEEAEQEEAGVVARVLPQPGDLLLGQAEAAGFEELQAALVQGVVDGEDLRHVREAVAQVRHRGAGLPVVPVDDVVGVAGLLQPLGYAPSEERGAPGFVGEGRVVGVAVDALPVVPGVGADQVDLTGAAVVQEPVDLGSRADAARLALGEREDDLGGQALRLDEPGVVRQDQVMADAAPRLQGG